MGQRIQGVEEDEEEVRAACIAKTNTLLGVPSCVRFCQQEFGEFPRLVGRSCSHLLPKQAGGTPQNLVDKNSRMTGPQT